MATQRGFPVCTDENRPGGSQAGDKSRGKRAPLGVLSDGNTRVGVCMLPTAGKLAQQDAKIVGKLLHQDAKIAAMPAPSNPKVDNRPAQQDAKAAEKSVQHETKVVDKTVRPGVHTSRLCDENECKQRGDYAKEEKGARPRNQQAKSLDCKVVADRPSREPLKPLQDVSMASPIPLGSLGSPMAVDEVEPPARKKPNDLFDDAFFTRDYAATHFAYMKDLELRFRAREDYMLRQRDITETMRSVLVDWLVEVSEEYDLNDENIFLAVNLIDRFLSVMSVVRAKLQLVGTAAMFIATKIEEIYPPQVSAFVYVTDDTYTKQQIFRMEALMLKTLSFNLSQAHALHFARRLAVVAGCRKETAHFAQYVCELSLLRLECLKFRASEVGAAALIVAMHNVDGSLDAWRGEVAKFAQVDLDRVRLLSVILHGFVAEAATSEYRAIPEKYSTNRYSSVAQLPILPSPPKL